MKIKTNELIGKPLDWAVAQAAGTKLCILAGLLHEAWFVNNECDDIPTYSPSTDWSQGGPILESEGITPACVKETAKGKWLAFYSGDLDEEGLYGPTALVAVMRAFVMYKLGDEVEIPEDLK